MANTRRMNRLEELGRVDSERAHTGKGATTVLAPFIAPFITPPPALLLLVGFPDCVVC